jgi:hypothetical protein
VTVGGTSLSSPLVSALYALAGGGGGGGGGVSYPAATLYSHLGQASLFDVTEGGNGYCDGEAVGPCGEPKINEELGTSTAKARPRVTPRPVMTGRRASARQKGSAPSRARRPL